MPSDTGIWFQTHHKGISFWSNQQQLKNLLPSSHPQADSTHRGQDIVTHAEADEEGKGLWVASLNGLLYYDWKQRRWSGCLGQLIHQNGGGQAYASKQNWLIEAKA